MAADGASLNSSRRKSLAGTASSRPSPRPWRPRQTGMDGKSPSRSRSTWYSRSWLRTSFPTADSGTGRARTSRLTSPPGRRAGDRDLRRRPAVRSTPRRAAGTCRRREHGRRAHRRDGTSPGDPHGGKHRLPLRERQEPGHDDRTTELTRADPAPDAAARQWQGIAERIRRTGTALCTARPAVFRAPTWPAFLTTCPRPRFERW